MKELLQSLNFKNIPQHGVDAWSKIYNGFILFIVAAPTGVFLASITVGKVEISLPQLINDNWVSYFDKENTELNEG